MISPSVRPSVPGMGASRLIVSIRRLNFSCSCPAAEAIARQAMVLNLYLYKSGRLNQFFTVSRYRNITTSNHSSTGSCCACKNRNTRFKFCPATVCSATVSGVSFADTGYLSPFSIRRPQFPQYSERFPSFHPCPVRQAVQEPVKLFDLWFPAAPVHCVSCVIGRLDCLNLLKQGCILIPQNIERGLEIVVTLP